MRSNVIVTGGSSLTELALAMRESSLVGKRVEGVCDGVGGSRLLMRYNYRHREEALYLGERRSWRVAADCKSVVLRLSWFESILTHQFQGL
jgi:hypothetical protein